MSTNFVNPLEIARQKRLAKQAQMSSLTRTDVIFDEIADSFNKGYGITIHQPK